MNMEDPVNRCFELSFKRKQSGLWERGRILMLKFAMVSLSALLGMSGLAGSGCGGKKEGTTPSPAAYMAKRSKDPFSALGILAEQPEDKKYKFSPGPKPPRTIANMVKEIFPPPQKPKGVREDYGPLKILRKQPEGTVGQTAAIAVSFNQPMIPLTSLEEQRKLDIPVEIRPKIEGQFRWLGTSVLGFESKSRFPFSTRYSVKIPAETKSAVGGVLEKGVEFSFETPRAKMTRMMPHSRTTHALPENPMVLTFNQKMNPEDVAAHAELKSTKGTIPVKLIPQEEWSEIKEYGSVHHYWDKERTVAVRPTKPMALNTHYTLTLAAGLGSEEGPLKTTAPQSSSFRTYGPLAVKWAGCWRGRPCDPGNRPSIVFTNAIETNEYTLERQIKITPKVKGLELRNSGSAIMLHGDFAPGTTYRVSVGDNIKDIYGQKLSRKFKGKIIFKNAAPLLQIATGNMGVLEAKEVRSLPVRSVNISKARVTLIDIKPENMLETINVLNESDWKYRESGKAVKLKGQRVRYGMNFNKKKNEVETSHIKLDKILKGRGGAVFVEVYSKQLAAKGYDYGYRHYLVSVTDLGLTARYDLDRIAGLVTGLTSGNPLKNVSVALYDGAHKSLWRGKTNKEGMVTPPGARKLGGKRPYLFVAKRDKDWSALVLRGSGSDGYISGYSYASLPDEKRLVSHIHTDRDPYRPGDKVEIVGRLRMAPTGPTGVLEPTEKRGVSINYTIHGPRGKEVKKGTLEVDTDGMFHTSFQSKAGAPLGRYRLRGRVHGLSGVSPAPYVYHQFSILEYRAPEHETQVEVKGGPHFAGDKIKAEIRGRYHFGAPMAGADASWVLHRRQGTYRPPHHTGFHFGAYRPYRSYWRHGYGSRGGRRGHYWVSGSSRGSQVAAEKGALDGDGRVEWTYEIPGFSEDSDNIHPHHYTLEAQVYDVNRQSIANRAQFLAHPADVYVGLRLEESIIKAGREANIQVVVPDLDGKRQTGRPVEITAEHHKTIRKKVMKGKTHVYEYETRKLTAGRCKVTSGKDVKVCKLVLNDPGYYILTASALDTKGRKTTTKQSVYVFGKTFVPWRQDNMRVVEMVPDKRIYKPGETAKILIKSPYRKAVGIMTVERQGIVSHRHLNITSSTHVEEVPIKEFEIPNVHISVVLVRGRKKGHKGPKGEDMGRPMFAKGRIPLKISKESKEISVEVLPVKKTIKPGETLTVKLKTKDNSGKPVSARLSLMAVDEGVLSLMGFQTPDPLSVFYPKWNTGTALTELRERLLKRVLPKLRLSPERPKRMRNGSSSGRGGYRRHAMESASMKSSHPPSMAGDKAAPGQSPGDLSFKVRKHFATTAFFSHKVLTDKQGHGELRIKMPENLTAFRFMAVAQDLNRPDRFGSGEERVRIRKDLLLRPALPRFANFGDIFEAGVVVNNETGSSGDVKVKIQGTGFRVLEHHTKDVTIEHGKAEEVRFKVAVTRPGLARFRFSAFKGRKTDSVEPAPIPVLLPASAEATAVYGVTEKSVAQPITPPEKVLPQFGGMKISMSSTALTGLQDAIQYLIGSPYNSAEHLASGLVPLFSLREVLPKFGLESLSDRKTMDEYAKIKIQSLISLQRYDGGFKYWPSNWRSYPYASVYATWALLRGKQAGFDIPDDVIKKASRYLSRVLSGRIRGSWHIYYSTTVRIMAGWLLTEMKDAKYLDTKLFSKYEMDRWRLKIHLHSLYELKSKVGLFAKAWLMTALHRIEKRSNRVEALLRELENKAIQTPYGVHFAEASTESLRLLMHSNTRTDAIVLGSYMEVDPRNVIVPKIVRALLAARVKGRWETTQSNAFVMESLAGYFKQYEKQVPDFQAHVWYGKGYAGTADFKGRSMEITEKEIPMRFLLKEGKNDLVLAKEGPGKLYYRLGIDYTPESLKLLPEEQGFMVRRAYEPVGDPDTVQKEKGGVWRVKAGSFVRVRLTVVVNDRRYFVAVNDPMPAGFEGVDLQLKTSASTHLSGKSRNKIYDFRSYFSFLGPNHKEMRDERYVLFWDRLPAGVYEYTYLVRATTMGRFVVPPLKAMEMYHPEVFGRNGTQVVIVE